MTESMTFDEVVFDDEARQQLLKGVDILARAVSTTLGPRGRNVIIERRGQSPILTKDGVTVARSVNLRNPFQQMGCQLVREVAQRTNDVAGDGTTTATTLAHALLTGGMKLLASGYSAIELKEGIDLAVKAVVAELSRTAIPVDDDRMIISVGTISANGEVEIGQLLAEAMSRVGRDGVITVEEAKGFKTTLEIVEGARFDRGYFSSYFVTDADKMLCELHDALVVVSNLRFSSAADIVPLLELASAQKRPLLVIADEVEGEVLQLMVTNHMNNILRSCAIRSPAFGEHRINMLHDIATLLGCRLITAGDGLSSTDSVRALFSSGAFGTCRRAVIDKGRTTFIGAPALPDVIQARVTSVKEKLLDPTLTHEERGMLNERLGKLASGIAILRIGGMTETELTERKYRVEDALNATQAAVKEGIVAGGGVALVRAAQVIETLRASLIGRMGVQLGATLVAEACNAPLRRIVDNAGGLAAVIVENEVKKSSSPTHGYDAANGIYVDVMEAGIIDPVKVTRTALENAASVVGLMLTANALVLDVKELGSDVDG